MNPYISQKSIVDPSGNLPLDSLFQRLMVIGKDPALARGPQHVLAPFWGATFFFYFRIMVKG
jgi:hypothetical protein